MGERVAIGCGVSSKEQNISACPSIGIRVYVLSGASNVGKTTTLNKLASFLGGQNYNLVSGSRLKKGSVDAEYVFQEMNTGIRVGVFTKGDTPGDIGTGFRFFIKGNCGVCFIASKTSGRTINEIENQCNRLKTIPQYMFLPLVVGCLRSRSQSQDDVAQQLAQMI